jgi:hypothetical protein
MAEPATAAHMAPLERTGENQVLSSLRLVAIQNAAAEHKQQLTRLQRAAASELQPG